MIKDKTLSNQIDFRDASKSFSFIDETKEENIIPLNTFD